MKPILLLIALFSVLVCCNPGVENTIIHPDKLLAVTSVISPADPLLKVYVHRSSSIGQKISKENTIEKNAEVMISDGDREVILYYNEESECYESDNYFQEVQDGTQFTLHVKTHDNLSVKAVSTLPPKPGQPELTGYTSDIFYHLTAEWNNTSGYPYFTVFGKAEGKFINPILGIMDIAGVSFEETGSNFRNQQPGRNILNGQIYIGNGLTDDVLVKITLVHIDDNLVKYAKTSRDYQNWLFNNDGSGIIPSFRENTPVHSNIEGGFGIFGSYNANTTSKKIN